MCVIIHRAPGITIPFEKLQSACIVNADGMGIVAYDRGKLELRKFFDPKGNDPEILQQHLEAAKDLHVYVHLRYRTKGSTDKANVHPFGVLKNKKHGMDIQFMHNGTLQDYGTSDTCDSKHFVKTLLTPLSEKLLKAVEPDVLIHDKTYLDILNKYAGKSSVFLLADSFGNHQIVNYDCGKEFDGWWASNEYSFNRTHREPSRTYKNYSKGYYLNGKWTEYESSPQADAPQWGKYTDYEEKKVISLPPLPPEGTESVSDSRAPFNDEVPWKEEVKEVAKKAPISPTLPTRERFIDIAEINDLSEVCQLSRVHIEDLVEEYPEQAVLLIMDLLKELYDKDLAMDEAAEMYRAA
jgi:hypothetical protein